MSSVNMNAIISKADKYIDSNKSGKVAAAMSNTFKKSIGKSNNNPRAAANALIDMITQYANAELSQGVANIASNLICGEPKYLGDGLATIEINFNDELNLQRKSLIGRYTNEDVNNIIALYNTGVDHEMKAVRGYWHNRYIESRTIIPETYFIQDAINSFKASFGDRYDVVNVELSPEYE